jgi:hypothetical protein
MLEETLLDYSFLRVGVPKSVCFDLKRLLVSQERHTDGIRIPCARAGICPAGIPRTLGRRRTSPLGPKLNVLARSPKDFACARIVNQKGDQRLRMLQEELRSLFAPIGKLKDMLSMTRWDAWDEHMSREENRVLLEIHGVLSKCVVTPALFVAHPRGGPPLLEWHYMPIKADHSRRVAIIAICALGRYGLLDRVRQCQRTADLKGGIC